jgi:hypothetical protein
MSIKSCIAVIPSFDLEKSLTLWRDCLGFSVESEMEQNGRMVFCMLRKPGLCFMLNQRDGSAEKPSNYEGIRLYWAPTNLQEIRAQLVNSGFHPSETVHRDCGRSEFFLIDDGGFSHCFGIESRA